MFKCANCHISFIFTVDFEKEHGDWIVKCPKCNAKNILSTSTINREYIPTFEIMGWKD
jgi:DNA-directed RNA polymerase subunit RPC12/RpoP